MKVGDVVQINPGRRYVYGLYDPADQAIRYVGTTRHPYTRLTQHYVIATKTEPGQAQSQKHLPLYRWILALSQAGRTPEMAILMIVEKDERLAEKTWIARLSLNDLLNMEHRER